MSGFPEKILLARDLASDGLQSTTPAARAAGDLAKKGGAELHVVYVWRTVPSPTSVRSKGADSKSPGVRRSRSRDGG